MSNNVFNRLNMRRNLAKTIVSLFCAIMTDVEICRTTQLLVDPDTGAGLENYQIVCYS